MPSTVAQAGTTPDTSQQQEGSGLERYNIPTKSDKAELRIFSEKAVITVTELDVDVARRLSKDLDRIESIKDPSERKDQLEGVITKFFPEGANSDHLVRMEKIFSKDGHSLSERVQKVFGAPDPNDANDQDYRRVVKGLDEYANREVFDPRDPEQLSVINSIQKLVDRGAHLREVGASKEEMDKNYKALMTQLKQMDRKEISTMSSVFQRKNGTTIITEMGKLYPLQMEEDRNLVAFLFPGDLYGGLSDQGDLVSSSNLAAEGYADYVSSQLANGRPHVIWKQLAGFSSERFAQFESEFNIAEGSLREKFYRSIEKSKLTGEEITEWTGYNAKWGDHKDKDSRYELFQSMIHGNLGPTIEARKIALPQSPKYAVYDEFKKELSADPKAALIKMRSHDTETKRFIMQALWIENGENRADVQNAMLGINGKASPDRRLSSGQIVDFLSPYNGIDMSSFRSLKNHTAKLTDTAGALNMRSVFALSDGLLGQGTDLQEAKSMLMLAHINEQANSTPPVIIDPNQYSFNQFLEDKGLDIGFKNTTDPAQRQALQRLNFAMHGHDIGNLYEGLQFGLAQAAHGHNPDALKKALTNLESAISEVNPESKAYEALLRHLRIGGAGQQDHSYYESPEELSDDKLVEHREDFIEHYSWVATKFFDKLIVNQDYDSSALDPSTKPNTYEARLDPPEAEK